MGAHPATRACQGVSAGGACGRDLGHMPHSLPANSGKKAHKRPFNPARMAHSRFSSMRLFTTENTPLTPFACTSAMLLSPPLFTTPSSVTLPFCTMM